MFISLEITCPRKFGPTYPSNCCMHISRFNCIKISPIFEKIPLYRPHAVALAALGVELGKLVSVIGDENRSQSLFDILEITPSAELTITTAETASVSASNIVTRSCASIWIDPCLEEVYSLLKLSHGDEMGDDRTSDHVDLHLFHGVAVAGGSALLANDGYLQVFVEQFLEIVVAAPV